MLFIIRTFWMVKEVRHQVLTHRRYEIAVLVQVLILSRFRWQVGDFADVDEVSDM